MFPFKRKFTEDPLTYTEVDNLLKGVQNGKFMPPGGLTVVEEFNGREFYSDQNGKRTQLIEKPEQARSFLASNMGNGYYMPGVFDPSHSSYRVYAPRKGLEHHVLTYRFDSNSGPLIDTRIEFDRPPTAKK